MSGERKKPGPKPRPVEDLARCSATFRMSEVLRGQLLGAAKANDRSLSEEILHRLEASFDQPALLEKLADILDRRRIAQERARLEAMLPKSYVLTPYGKLPIADT